MSKEHSILYDFVLKLRGGRREGLGQAGFEQENEKVRSSEFWFSNGSSTTFREFCPYADIANLTHVM